MRPPRRVVDAIIADACASKILDHKGLDLIIRRHLHKTPYRFPLIPEMITSYRAGACSHPDLERLLRYKTVRTDSGVAPITLLTKPYACPGKCVYCPTEVRMPKSYVASEPAAARALALKFDPYAQVRRRAEALERNGHEAKKIELIIKGGTWSAYPWTYRKWFIKRCFDAANHLGMKKRKRFGSLAASQAFNEGAEYRVIGLTIETRPDWITPQEIVRLRELGVTRVELGVQALDDDILTLTKRGHSVADTVLATALLKQVGFKTDYHILPGQPGSTPEKDIAMFDQLFTDDRFRPDMIKLYPCVVLPSAELAEWHRQGKFVPLEGEALIEMMVRMQSVIPRYCRVSRLIRDFPSHEISGGNKITNLRELIEQRMRERGIACQCLRCREIGHAGHIDPTVEPQLCIETYENAGGIEHFLSFEDPDRKVVYAFLRLRLPNWGYVFSDPKIEDRRKQIRESFPELEGSALIRELHTYGQALALKQDRAHASQHKGLGRRLIEEAETMARRAGYRTISVISGIGVRAYYRSLGYHSAGTYMQKII